MLRKIALNASFYGADSTLNKCVCAEKAVVVIYLGKLKTATSRSRVVTVKGLAPRYEIVPEL